MNDKGWFRSPGETIQVNLSTPFMLRSRCKGCGEQPSLYYYGRNPTLWYNPRKIDANFALYKKFFTRMCMDFYLADDPSSFNNISSFSCPVTYKGYKPRIHKNKYINPVMDFTEYFTCYCGETIWAFYDKSGKNRPEIVNRKSRRLSPQKFKY